LVGSVISEELRDAMDLERGKDLGGGLVLERGEEVFVCGDGFHLLFDERLDPLVNLEGCIGICELVGAKLIRCMICARFLRFHFFDDLSEGSDLHTHLLKL
jgi:hypothetical protein